MRRTTTRRPAIVGLFVWLTLSLVAPSTAIAVVPAMPEDVERALQGGGGGGSGPLLNIAAKTQKQGTTRPTSTQPSVEASVSVLGTAVDRLFTEDKDVQSAVKAALMAELRNPAEVATMRASVIKSRNAVDWIIFGVTHILLGVGLWAAVHEFRQAERVRERGAATGKEAEADVTSKTADGTPPVRPLDSKTADRTPPPATELELGLEKMALKTSLHGLLLLAVSFGFYFMYLKFVHPIVVVGSGTTSEHPTK